MTEKTIPVGEASRNLKDILSLLEVSGQPQIITQNDSPQAVLLRYEDYQALVEQAADAHPRIVRKPGISGGEPIILGTRISVRHIVERVQAGQSVEDILAALPHLTAAQIHDALSFYYDHKAEIDRLVQESQTEQVIAAQGLQVEKVAEGVAVVRLPS